jgi:hypothetical protein
MIPAALLCMLDCCGCGHSHLIFVHAYLCEPTVYIRLPSLVGGQDYLAIWQLVLARIREGDSTYAL